MVFLSYTESSNNMATCILKSKTVMLSYLDLVSTSQMRMICVKLQTPTHLSNLQIIKTMHQW